jgi:hypothetical protein
LESSRAAMPVLQSGHGELLEDFRRRESGYV